MIQSTLYRAKKLAKSFLVKREINKSGFYFYLDEPQPHVVSKQPYHLINGVVITNRNQYLEKISFTSDSGVDHIFNLTERKDQEILYPDLEVKGFSTLLEVIENQTVLRGNIHLHFQNKNEHKIPLTLKSEEGVLKNFKLQKLQKQKRVISNLRCPNCFSDVLHTDENIKCDSCKSIYQHQSAFNFLDQQAVELGKVEDTSNISANAYNLRCIEIIDQYKDGLILDFGAGLRKECFNNVVNFEIVNYPTTDVVGIGEKLPFKDNSFDGVFSFAVLEHVQNPFQCAEEIMRVLKPGGKLFVSVPFLQPFHGYPNHFFNMTSSGLKRLFEEKIDIEKVEVRIGGHPIWMLTWVLNSYVQGLPPKAAKKFKSLKVKDLLGHPSTYYNESFFKELSSKAQEELACANHLEGVKKV